MKILFHFTITLFVLNLVACNQTKSPEPIKQYTFIGGKEGDKIDTTSFDSLQLSDPFILADEETQMYYLVGSGGSLWKSTNMKKWTGPYQYITVDTTSWIGTAPRIWAPELHKYKGKYYLSHSDNHASTQGGNQMQYSVSDNPLGPFTPCGVYMYPQGEETAHG